MVVSCCCLCFMVRCLFFSPLGCWSLLLVVGCVFIVGCWSLVVVCRLDVGCLCSDCWLLIVVRCLLVFVMV